MGNKCLKMISPIKEKNQNIQDEERLSILNPPSISLDRLSLNLNEQEDQEHEKYYIIN